MSEEIVFKIDGQTVIANHGETIWQTAMRYGNEIPHLCHSGEPNYRPDGNCRLCMVEIEGERVLAPSCIRSPKDGMVVHTDSSRVTKCRNTIMDMLSSDQPDANESYDKSSEFYRMAEITREGDTLFPALENDRQPQPDLSHPAMAVNLDACIHCGLCVRACNEIQVNNVIGMSGRGHDAKIIFDLDDPMGDSTCVACGECVQSCPTGALMPASLSNEQQLSISDKRDVDSHVDTVCPYCGVGCQIRYHVKEDRILFAEGLQGPSNEGRLCVKGRFGFDYSHHKHRLQKPLIRIAGIPKGLNVDPDNPMTHFREASWEEALQVAVEGFARLRDDYSGEAVAGFGSAKCSNEEAYLFQKLIRTAFLHNNVDHCTRLCHASSVAALMEMIGSGAVTAPFGEIVNANCAIVIGSNTTENHPVAATYFKQFVNRGGKLFVLDPRNTSISKISGRHLRFKPGTDVALLNAIMNVIVNENLADHDYINSKTENYEIFRDNIMHYTPELMSPICGIDVQNIRDIARTFASAEKAMIFWGMGVSQHTHGTDNARCLISLALLTGNIGRPGTGLHPLRGQNNVQGASDAGLIPMVLPDYQSVKDENIRSFFNKLWNTTISDIAGLTVIEIMHAISDDKIKGMYILGENPAMSDPDLKHSRQSLAKLQHCVVQDVFLTETACYADVILPASVWMEKNGTATNTNRQIQMGRKVLSAPGDAKEDWWIICEIAKRLGLPWTYSHPSEVFTEMTECMPSLNNITWERVDHESSVTYPSLSPEDPGQSVIFGDGFPRPSKKAKFSPTSIVQPAEPTDNEFPLVLTTCRQLEHWHTGSMTRRAIVLDSIEPSAVVSVNPEHLNAIGIAPGDPVKVTTRRGSIVLTARSDNSVTKDMISIPFAYVEAAANILTHSKLDPFGKIPEFKYSACRLEKIHTNTV